VSDAAIVGWFTLASALGTALIAGLIGLGLRKMERNAEEQRRKEEREDRRQERIADELAQTRREGAEAVGRARWFLEKADPEWLTAFFDEDWEKTVDRLEAEVKEIQNALGILAVLLATKQARDIAERLNLALQNVWLYDDLTLRFMANPDEDHGEFLKDAQKWWKRADSLSKELREALHEAE
jgi:CRISPR/Cas system CSM-associated protein Csm2 small subunit